MQETDITNTVTANKQNFAFQIIYSAWHNHLESNGGREPETNHDIWEESSNSS